MKDALDGTAAGEWQPGEGELLLRIDGRQPLSADRVAAVAAVCDSAEDLAGQARVIVQVSGTPEGPWTDDLTVALVSKWERALRRLERLPATVIAIADGDCGGPALDALLATDYRIATGTVRLMLPVGDDATWPGMALYRLANQGANAAAIRRAVLFGAPVSAAEARALHLVDELSDDLAGAFTAAAGLTGALSGTELAIRRQLLFDAATTSFDEALGVHLAACDRALRRASAGAAR
ncbi:enoyl-CoA-hydratase DpgB [Peterkaempfera griseoplana]|uniref:enoyl-CoA-hydratase DpgB n=1 Tax=Peterkaempfera griseoplana TaxID=66896 RepID=UPI0006E356AB|nr:enoyl-CoA-hydratase DpgB [Peterkaempfera griseoplana]